MIANDLDPDLARLDGWMRVLKAIGKYGPVSYSELLDPQKKSRARVGISGSVLSDHIGTLESQKAIERIRRKKSSYYATRKAYQITEIGNVLLSSEEDKNVINAVYQKNRFVLTPGKDFRIEDMVGSVQGTVGLYSTSELFTKEYALEGEKPEVPILNLAKKITSTFASAIMFMHVCRVFHEADLAWIRDMPPEKRRHYLRQMMSWTLIPGREQEQLKEQEDYIMSEKLPTNAGTISVKRLNHFDATIVIHAHPFLEEDAEIQRRRLVTYFCGCYLIRETRGYYPKLNQNIVAAMRQGRLLTQEDYRSIKGKTIDKAVHILYERYGQAFIEKNCPHCRTTLKPDRMLDPREWNCERCKAESISNPKLTYSFSEKDLRHKVYRA